jgi:DNA-binding NtrC family response regulator
MWNEVVMNNSVQSVKVHVTGLEEPMRHELSDALRSISCHLTDEPRSADIVFCGWDPDDVSKRISAYGRKPVVVVSRLPDVSGWLDALEAGAADYCAAPFESVQLRWIIDAQMRRRVRSAAA